MWQLLSTVIHAAVKTKKKNLADALCGITKGALGEEPRRTRRWPLSLPVALSDEPPATNNMSMSDWSLLSPVSDETLTSA